MNDLETNVRPQRRRMETFEAVQFLFLEALAIVYFIAFLSFGMQVTGLIGEHGILPLASFVPRAAQVLGGSRWRVMPMVFWLNSSDGFLNFICFLGAACAVVAFIGKGWRIALILCYLCYLSLVYAGQDFMSYQWDMLLLETGFLAIFTGWHPLVLWLYRWLLFTLHDAAVLRWIPRRVGPPIRPIDSGRVTRPIGAAAAGVILALTIILLVSEVAGRTWRPATALVRVFAPFGIANNYGLFAVM